MAWMQLSFTPSSWPQCRSISKICTEKAAAQPRSIRSPLLMLPLPVQLRRYRPTTAGIRLSTALRPGFWPVKSPRKGTNTMYMAVRKPAFPASVYTRPICWRLDATKRAVPQIRPERHRPGLVHSCFHRAVPFFRSIKKDSGNRNSTARPQRKNWKVKGPMESMPTLWAIKAEPQISVVPSSVITPNN